MRPKLSCGIAHARFCLEDLEHFGPCEFFSELPRPHYTRPLVFCAASQSCKPSFFPVSGLQPLLSSIFRWPPHKQPPPCGNSHQVPPAYGSPDKPLQLCSSARAVYSPSTSTDGTKRAFPRKHFHVSMAWPLLTHDLKNAEPSSD